MAVIRVNQGEIVEVPFELPDGSILPHPALVISNEYLQDYEDGLFYVRSLLLISLTSLMLMK